jgi:hypothetical protein
MLRALRVYMSRNLFAPNNNVCYMIVLTTRWTVRLCHINVFSRRRHIFTTVRITTCYGICVTRWCIIIHTLYSMDEVKLFRGVLMLL